MPRGVRVWLVGGVVVLMIMGAVAWYVMQQGNRSSNEMVQKTTVVAPSPVPTLPLKSEYDNPFEKQSQYVNPFSDYKNPFDSLSQ